MSQSKDPQHVTQPPLARSATVTNAALPPCALPTELAAAFELLAARADFERFPAMPYSEGELKLDRMRELLARLGNPEKDLPIVHVAGTKGKGSVAAMLSAVLTAAGYRCGRFTSPHIQSVEERVAVDGQPITRRELAELLAAARPAIETMDREAAARGALGPTFFELTTALALMYFRRRAVQIAILEVGLGGRLDSTNVCQPLVAVITSISLDHTKQLGETRAQIAAEKAGIIKPGVTVVSGVSDAEPRAVIRQVAAEQGCRIVELGTDFSFRYEPPRNLEIAPATGSIDWWMMSAPLSPRGIGAEGEGASQDSQAVISGSPPSLDRFATTLSPWKRVALAMPGRHQAANAAVALAVITELLRRGWSIGEEAICEALAGLRWPARVEVVARRPAVVLDVAHNVASVEALLSTLDESFAVCRRLLVFGTSQDKDARGMLQRLLPCFDEVFLTQFTVNPRGMPAAEMMAAAESVRAAARPIRGAAGGHTSAATKALIGRPQVQIAASPTAALAAALAAASPEDLICIAGSFYLVAECRAGLEGTVEN